MRREREGGEITTADRRAGSGGAAADARIRVPAGRSGRVLSGGKERWEVGVRRTVVADAAAGRELGEVGVRRPGEACNLPGC